MLAVLRKTPWSVKRQTFVLLRIASYKKFIERLTEELVEVLKINITLERSKIVESCRN